ncbi:MAG TPA: hypothetical protein VIK84_04535 [Haloplasmataceae bacterium]
MKKVLSIFLMLFMVFIISSCGKKGSDNLIKELGKKVEDVEMYEVDAIMDVKEMNKSHIFDINIKYLKPDFYKVTLKNRDSNNIQIVLKNKEGVYVLTPALNKSFKFQSDWPLNSSQPYLFQSLVKDILNDKDAIVVKQNDHFEIKTKVNYRRSSELITQKIIIDGKTLFPKEVIVLDGNNQEKITVSFNEVKYKCNFNKDEFKLEYSMNSAINTFKNILPTFNERCFLFPTMIGKGTELKQETTVDTANGKRVIMTFAGTSSFTVVEEYINPDEELGASKIIYGDPVIICTGIAFQTENTLTWHENGIEFFLISEDMTPDEMYVVANSFFVNTSK